jgi:hypothetical protein
MIVAPTEPVTYQTNFQPYCRHGVDTFSLGDSRYSSYVYATAMRVPVLRMVDATSAPKPTFARLRGFSSVQGYV